MAFKLHVNGKVLEADVDPDTPLLWTLRDTLGILGPKFGCGVAQCGACTVHIDGKATRSCVFPVSAVGDKQVGYTAPTAGGGGKLLTINDAKTRRIGMFTMTQRLIAEFEGAPAGRVIAVVARSRHQLVISGVHRLRLIHATESVARTNLRNAA